MNKISVFLTLFTLINAKVYFHEQFDPSFSERWTYSEDSSIAHGQFTSQTNEYCSTGDSYIKAVNDSSFYHASAKLKDEFSTDAHVLFLSYIAWFSQEIDCGGAYIKLFGDLDQKKFNGDSAYNVMVGPDVCGPGKRIVHLIISHSGKNYGLKDNIDYTVDKYPHLISLVISAHDQTFKISVDNKVSKQGAFKEHFDYLLPEFIDDPSDTKPQDWEDNENIDDPDSKKPEDWDDNEKIPDPDAKKPDNWDDSTDEEWEPNLIPNPNYKGEWTPKQIPNPNYKGVWKARQIPNPDYKDDKDFGKFSVKFVGFDLWMVKSGTIFDEVFISDDKDESEKHDQEIMKIIGEQVEKIKEKEKEEQKKAEQQAKEEEKADTVSEEPEPSETLPESDDETQKEAQHEDL